jgi:hypothetical protein
MNNFISGSIMIDKKRMKALKKLHGQNFHHLYNVQSNEVIKRIFEALMNPNQPLWLDGEFRLASYGYGRVPNQMGFMLQPPQGPQIPLEITFIPDEDGFEVFFKLVYAPNLPKLAVKMVEKIFGKKYSQQMINVMDNVQNNMLQFPTGVGPSPDPNNNFGQQNTFDNDDGWN